MLPSPSPTPKLLQNPMSAEGPPETVEVNGKTYQSLADGEYDAIVLGTGLKECILSGLLATDGMRVRPG